MKKIGYVILGAIITWSALATIMLHEVYDVLCKEKRPSYYAYPKGSGRYPWRQK